MFGFFNHSTSKLLTLLAATCLLSGCIEPAPPANPPTSETAARFLHQATFGPNQTDVDELVALGWEEWMNQQFSKPVTDSHYQYIERNGKPSCVTCNASSAGDSPSEGGVIIPTQALHSSFWYQALEGKDQLRQRVAFALSQLFVVSTISSSELADYPQAVGSFHDVLLENAFGDFRVLLDKVSVHPAMGAMLSHRQNDKEDATTGRVPDENFSRELMQLFTIGKWKLNADGTRQKDGNGNEIPTYSQNDIMGMAKTMSGWSWGGDDEAEERWQGLSLPSGENPINWNLPLKPYANHHSSSEKRILNNVVIPSNTNATTSMKIALDTLFNHPNTGPFVATHLIKRLVTSNPSPAYVSRVASVFASDKNAQRGNMRAVVRAVLFDPEASDPAKLTDPTWGKMREPVIRVANLLRAFKAKNDLGAYIIYSNIGNVYHGQNPWSSPTVFNFFTPDFQPLGNLSDQNLTAPEFEIFNESTAAGYVNYINTSLEVGFSYQPISKPIVLDYNAEKALANNATSLTNRLAMLLNGGYLSSSTRSGIEQAINAIPSSTDNDLLRRVKTAALLVVASPDYLIQK